MSGEPVQPDDDPLTPPPYEGRFARLIRCTEEWFFVAILLALVGVGLAPIIARRFDLGSITWSVDVSRQLVLWIALFGAGAATRVPLRARVVVPTTPILPRPANTFPRAGARAVSHAFPATSWRTAPLGTPAGRLGVVPGFGTS